MSATTVDWRQDEEGLLSAYYIDPADGVEKKAGWAPQPGSQELFLQCPVFETLYEGTRGPGKTDALLMDFAQHTGPKRVSVDGVQLSGWGPEWRGILFRQTYPQLSDFISKSKKWFPRIFPNIKFNEAKTTWVWATGETLRLSYIQKSDDYWNYHGHAYPWIGFEELTTWPTDECFTVMMSCCRSTEPNMPRKYRATTNPYGPGHNWVKMRYDLPLPPGRVVGDIIREEGKPSRVAIRGRLDENQILLTSDPEYIPRIKAAARNENELAAWIDGSWDIVAGGMFDDRWVAKHHVVPAFDVPRSWIIDRSFDWGSSAPFSVGWWAESDGTDLTFRNGKVMSTVRGDLFRWNEWYGWTGKPNEGLRMLATEISAGMVQREVDWGIRKRVKMGPADSSIFNVENGMSISKDMMDTVRYKGRTYNGVRWLRADKRPGSRMQGWEQMRKAMENALPQLNKDGKRIPREKPGLFVTENCRQFIRTVPVLPRDQKKLDDVDTDTEDHIGDDCRYRIRFVGRGASTGRTAGTGS